MGTEDSFDLTDVLKILYQALLQSIDDTFRILDRDYRLLWVNKRESRDKLGQVCYAAVFERDDPWTATRTFFLSLSSDAKSR